MIKLVDARDLLYTAADFWLYAGEVVVATIKVNPRHTPHEYQKRRKDWGVAIAAALPNEQKGGSDTNWAGERHLGIPATAVWLTKMGCDPQPFLTLAAERGWDSEIIAEATEAVEKEKARLVPPVDYLVIFMRCGVQDGYGYLPFHEVVSAMEEYCDTEIGTVNNGDFFSVTDETGERDALAYPLYHNAERAPASSGTAIPVEIRIDIQDRAACGGFAPPETPGEWLAWILDEARLQAEQADAAQDNEERQARLKYVTLLKATANRLIKTGVEAAKLPWQKTTLKLSERWRDGLREGLERVIAEVEVDSYGVTVMVENERLEDTSEVLVEFYNGAVTAHVWRAEDFDGDPTATIELFKVEAKEAQHG